MTKHLPVPPAPGPLEDYAEKFDNLFGAQVRAEMQDCLARLSSSQ